MNNTGYILRFTLILTCLSALILSGMFYSTKPMADRAEAVFNKRAILSSVSKQLPKSLDEMSDSEVMNIFENKIEQKVIDMDGNPVADLKAENVNMEQEEKKPLEDRYLPFFVYENEKGEKFYIIAVRGSGLWDKIWGNIALESDLKTVAGASFDHKAETPGLGAEIKDNPAFAAQFIGKKIYSPDGEFVSVIVRKGGAKDPYNEVDGISGATITCNGVNDMLEKGIQYYEPYFKEIKSDKQTGMK